MKQIVILGLCILLSINVFSQTTDTSKTFKVQIDENKVENIDYEPHTIECFFPINPSASFQGGTINDFRNWVNLQIQYPDSALKANAQGIVIVTFRLNAKGFIDSVNILKSSGFKVLDEEAMRVILTSPQWVPAKIGGSDVAQFYNIPIAFKLNP